MALIEEYKDSLGAFYRLARDEPMPPRRVRPPRSGVSNRVRFLVFEPNDDVIRCDAALFCIESRQLRRVRCRFVVNNDCRCRERLFSANLNHDREDDEQSEK